MGLDFKKWLGILTAVAPVIMLAVPGGAAFAPLIPSVIVAIADAQQKPGATGVEKKAYVLQIAKDAFSTTNLVHPGTVDAAVMLEAVAHGVDAVIGAVNAVQKAHDALPSVPSALALPPAL